MSASTLQDSATPSPCPETAHEQHFQLEDRSYRVRGMGKNLAYDALRVNVLVTRANREGLHIDTFDLYAARHRQSFVTHAARELDADESDIKRDLGRLLLELEAVQDDQIRAAAAPARAEVKLTPEEEKEALELLRAPDLLATVAADFERCGVIGESTNLLVGFLAAVSRKLEDPLAVVWQSSSSAGKTSLMEAVLAFVPPEDRMSYSAMTGQSLYYLGQKDLRHKVLAIAEEVGAERASYALKLLQSERRLTIAATGRDPTTGRMATQDYVVEGPVALFFTTTAVRLDPELMNRSLVLTVDEDRGQTRAIQAAQRQAETLAGTNAKQQRDAVVKRQQNAQRLLKPLRVLNPHAESLGFVDHLTRTRRDQPKFLALIRAVALLHQHQRQRRTLDSGEAYIEATTEDIELAQGLMQVVLRPSLDELAPQTRRLLTDVQSLAQEEPEVWLTRADIRQKTPWTYDQLRVHLARLVELEYLLMKRTGPGRTLAYQVVVSRLGEPYQLGGIGIELGSPAESDNRSESGVLSPTESSNWGLG